MSHKKSLAALGLVAGAVFGLANLAPADDAPTSQPAASTDASGVIDVSNKDAITAALDQEAIVQGVVEKAAWSNSGKVMNIEFKGAEESRFLAVAFVNNKQKLDEAFGGDAAKAFSGATLRLSGTIRPYGGKSKKDEGRPEMIIKNASQVTIVTPASQPAE